MLFVKKNKLENAVIYSETKEDKRTVKVSFAK